MTGNGTTTALRVLQLEDAPGDAELAMRELRKAGLVVSARRVETRDDFVRALDQFEPDVILVDYKIPAFDGLSAVRIAVERRPQTPSIVVTGTLGDGLAAALLREGARDYILKDRLARLASAVRQAVEDARTEVGRREAQEQSRRALAKLHRTLEKTVEAVAATVEMRDPYTAGHERRVAGLATAIAREMKLSEAEIEGVHFGALIHDLGKIQVPAEILSKPTRLSSIEFELIKSHPRAGHEIIKGIEFPWPVARMVLEHHERLDGSGYPQGLKGDAIALESRILAVADVVEAMSSHRPYRPGLGIEAALKEIEEKRDRWFDPQAVDACLRLFREKRFTFG
jgi:putative nucleotidyltransferase with HDIG domain